MGRSCFIRILGMSVSFYILRVRILFKRSLVIEFLREELFCFIGFLLVRGLGDYRGLGWKFFL